MTFLRTLMGHKPKGLFFVVQMNIHLRERNIQFFFCKCLVYFFIHVKEYSPIIGGIDPSPDNNVYGAFAQGG